MVNTKNILIIGRVGSGKSALANLLVNKKESLEEGGRFEEFFKESDSSVSETREIKSKEAEIERINYRIIDTIGIGNAELTDEELTYKITETCYKLKDGLTQVLFVIGGRFAKEEIKIYNIIKKLCGEEITKYTTIVRTKFHNFQDPEQCETDKKKLKEENKRGNKKIRKMANLCNEIIYIDNPSLNSVNKEEEKVYKKRKKESRDKILKHLSNYQEIYKINNLELISEIPEDGKKDEVREILEKERQEAEKTISFKRVKQLLRRKPETVEEIKRSSLEAFVEINSRCR